MATRPTKATPGYSSPPCFLHELGETPDGYGVSDPQQALDVARWRRATRASLLAKRAALPVDERAALAEKLGEHLIAVLHTRFKSLHGKVLSGYWPIKSELDLRDTLGKLTREGVTCALPVVEQKSNPLVFHAWKTGDKMERGFWDILVPAEKRIVIPDILLAPLVGWDSEGFRLGYGGGYFDRTLAALKTPHLVIGVGIQSAEVPTIFPQSHDVRLDVIITENGAQWSAPL